MSRGDGAPVVHRVGEEAEELKMRRNEKRRIAQRTRWAREKVMAQQAGQGTVVEPTPALPPQHC